MPAQRTVAIDSLSESPKRHSDCDAVVIVDVISDASTLVTAVAQRRAVFLAASEPAALSLARRLPNPLLATAEDAGWRTGFELPNSPAALATRIDRRPLVLACATGAAIADNGGLWPDIYIACFRNLSATARHLAMRYRRVLVLDAAVESDTRCEDQMAAARIARELVMSGFVPEGFGTLQTLERWGQADLSLASWGRSAEDLRRRRRHEDLDFVLSHLDDLDVACQFSGGRLQATADQDWASDTNALPVIA